LKETNAAGMIALALFTVSSLSKEI
jgi:hypothetical protein